MINPEPEPCRSFAYFTIAPLNDVPLDGTIVTQSDYDESGEVEREDASGVLIQNTINVQPPINPPSGGISEEPPVEAATSNESILYDTVQDTYFSTRAGLVRRMGHFAAGLTPDGTADRIYVFGGFTGNAEAFTTNITPLVEAFDIATQTWEFTTDMPTARAFGQTVVSGNTVYCIGGIEIDPMTSQYVVSRKIEAFDTVTELWNTTLAPMPEDLGVAYGDAQIIDGNIYIVCGINTILNNSEPGDLSTKILRYSIADDEWATITPSDELLYARLTPFGWYRNPSFTQGDVQRYYVFGGSIPKPQEQIDAEVEAIVEELLVELQAFLLSSSYFQNLTEGEQEAFQAEKEQEIRDSVNVPAFIYLSTGFKFKGGSEVLNNGILTMDISDTVDDEWPILPKARDAGKAIYIAHQDSVYLIGGANQNQSTTLNRNESIDHIDDSYRKNTSLNRGRAYFAAVVIGDEIYFNGGLTSGHKPGWIEIDVQVFPEFVEALGTQSAGYLVTLRNDSGEILEDDVTVNVRGRLRMDELDSVLVDFLVTRGTDRALGGDGSGNAPETQGGSLGGAANSILDPNSDQFQFNAARKLTEDVLLFPILFSSNEFTVSAGIGGVTLLPRSEDPLADFEKLAEFINTLLGSTPETETFDGDLTRQELAALGDTLTTVKLPPTRLNSGSLRELYDVEAIFTIIDDFYFGQTVSELDFNIQQEIKSKIEQNIEGPDPEPPPPGGEGGAGEGEGGEEPPPFPPPPSEPPEEEEEVTLTSLLTLSHTSSPDPPFVPPPSSGGGTSGSGGASGPGGFPQSGQCLFCDNILPLGVTPRPQLPTVLVTFFNATDWVPQIKNRIVDNESKLQRVIDELERIDNEIPFGSSQLYGAMFEAARLLAGELLDDVKKSIYIASDNSQNLSLVTRDAAIEEVNSIDGDLKVPVVYTVFSTSFPLSIAALLQRAELGDIEKITQETGGQSTTLIESGFINEILNLTIGSATGGLGFGIYTKIIEFAELSAFTSMDLEFSLPPNTRGFVRFRHSKDGFNFGDLSERFEGSQTIDFVDFFAKSIEIEIVLTTGFTEGITPEYDTVATGVPKLLSITFEISGEKIDFIFLDKEDVLTNVQQLASTFEGDVPENADVEIGVAGSQSHDWRDFQSAARPPIKNLGKTFFIDRTDDVFNFVPQEFMTTLDEQLYTTVYGPWDPSAKVTVLRVVEASQVGSFTGAGSTVSGTGTSGEGSGAGTGGTGSGTGTSSNGGGQAAQVPSFEGGAFGGTSGGGGTGGTGGGGTGGTGSGSGSGSGSGEGGIEIGGTGGATQESTTVDVPVLSGFQLYARAGQVLFDTRQPPDAVFKLEIINSDKMRVGLRLINRLHTQSIAIEGVGYIYSTNDVKPVELSQVAPKAINVTISPQNPTSVDTIFALYDYVDLNGDPESGTIISWFKNGVQLIEIQGKTSFSNEDLTDVNKMAVNDKIFFSVQPSDGRDLGQTVFSPAVIITPTQPGAGGTQIVPYKDGAVFERFDTSSTFQVEYAFETEDVGTVEDGTVVRWIVNGETFKEGTFSELDLDENGVPIVTAKIIVPGESVGTVLAHTIGNTIQAEVTPKTTEITGLKVTTQEIIVVNTIPVAENVVIDPASPTQNSTLEVSYDIVDIDIDGGIQSDASEIRWYRALQAPPGGGGGQGIEGGGGTGGGEFEVVSELNNLTTVASSFLTPGEAWFAEVTPSDGQDLGIPVPSNVVVIQA